MRVRRRSNILASIAETSSRHFSPSRLHIAAAILMVQTKESTRQHYNNMNNYKDIIDQINAGIREFNGHLSASQAIPMLGSVTDNSFMNIAEIPWEKQFWPNKDAKGVYFLFGYKESAPSIPALYIGKASLGNIGERLYSHLNHSRNEPHYRLNDASGAACIIDFVTSIDLSTRHIPSLAVALEEFLIKSMKSKAHLINAVGNN